MRALPIYCNWNMFNITLCDSQPVSLAHKHTLYVCIASRCESESDMRLVVCECVIYAGHRLHAARSAIAKRGRERERRDHVQNGSLKVCISSALTVFVFICCCTCACVRDKNAHNTHALVVLGIWCCFICFVCVCCVSRSYHINMCCA